MTTEVLDWYFISEDFVRTYLSVTNFSSIFFSFYLSIQLRSFTNHGPTRCIRHEKGIDAIQKHEPKQKFTHDYSVVKPAYTNIHSISIFANVGSCVFTPSNALIFLSFHKYQQSGDCYQLNKHLISLSTSYLDHALSSQSTNSMVTQYRLSIRRANTHRLSPLTMNKQVVS